MPAPVFPKTTPADVLRKVALSASLLVALGLLTACAGMSSRPVDPMALQMGDRCYIEDSQFAFADQMYDRMGSIQLVEQELCNIYQWRPCEINEALYRLRKVHDLP